MLLGELLIEANSMATLKIATIEELPFSLKRTILKEPTLKININY